MMNQLSYYDRNLTVLLLPYPYHTIQNYTKPYKSQGPSCRWGRVVRRCRRSRALARLARAAAASTCRSHTHNRNSATAIKNSPTATTVTVQGAFPAAHCCFLCQDCPRQTKRIE
eukprot:5131203-Pleurochrysis_carterae.AAC.2